jgi:hypothetical protein
MSWLSGQANTPPPSGGFFNALATNGLAINLEKCVFAAPLLKPWPHDFGDWSGPYGRSRRRNRKLPAPSGYQTATTLSRHGKLLPPFFAKVCSSPKTFD